MTLRVSQILVQAKEDVYLERSKITKKVDRGKKVAFRLYKTTLMKEVMEKVAMCAWQVPLDVLEFDYLGILVCGTDTIETLKMHDGDIILARNSSFNLPISTLSTDLKHLTSSTYGADFVFKVGTTKSQIKESLDIENSENYQEIYVHRCILRCRSEKLRGMFDSVMKENTIGHVLVPHHSPKIFRIMLEYLYTDQFPTQLTTKEEFWELLVLADEYLLGRLVKFCEFQLLKFIDLDSVFGLYSSSERFKTEDLKFGCKQFISQHYNQIVNHKEFLHMCKQFPGLLLVIPKINPVHVPNPNVLL